MSQNCPETTWIKQITICDCPECGFSTADRESVAYTDQELNVLKLAILPDHIDTDCPNCPSTLLVYETYTE